MPHTYLEGVEFALAVLPPIAGVLSVVLVALLAALAVSRAGRTVRDRVLELRRRRAVDRMLAVRDPWESAPPPSTSSSTNRYL